MAGSGTAHLRPPEETLLRVENLVMEYPAGRHQKVYAVSNVSLDVKRGETLGLVGESGCGKSTVGKAIIQFPHPTAGHVWYDGSDLTTIHGQELRRKRSKLQMIFQDPISSLNPRRRIGDIVGEGLSIWKPTDGRDPKQIVIETMEAVGLDPNTVQGRRPHEFSGGQCQRISIARSLAIEPELLICDEPVAALDVSIQAQILNLLEDMKERYGLTMIFIAHDLAVVKLISDRIVVMYLGKVCEVGPADTLYAEPLHPYTRALLDSVPVPDPEVPIQPPAARGELPSPLNPPSGCRFRTRCPRAEQVCAEEEPIMRELVPGHFAACHFPLIEGKGNGAGSHVISSQSEMGDWNAPVGVSVGSSATATATMTDTEAAPATDVEETSPFAPPTNGHGDSGADAAPEAKAQDEAAPDAPGGSEA
jgi:peptide/nickel transport system ATP-binding protein